MTRRDIERYVQRQTGVTPAADRDVARGSDIRYRPETTLESLAIPDYPLALDKPPGFLAANTTAVSTFVSNATYARYLGRACKGLNQVDLLIEVLTASVGAVTWSEFGIGFSGDITLLAGGSPLDIQMMQYLDTSARTTSTGRKVIQIIDLPQSIQGTHIWLLMGGQAATTQFQIRAGLPDVVQAGYIYSSAATRPSTMSGYVTFTNETISFPDLWVDYKQRTV
jgi:hypothetical protein